MCNYIAGVHTELNQNLLDFTVLPFTAFPSSTLRPLPGTCFASNSSLTIIPDLVQRVINCTDFGIDKRCCYNAAEDEVRPVRYCCTVHNPTLLCREQNPTAHCLCNAGQHCMSRKHTTSDACLLISCRRVHAAQDAWPVLVVRVCAACMLSCVHQAGASECPAAAWPAGCLQVNEYIFSKGHFSMSI